MRHIVDETTSRLLEKSNRIGVLFLLMQLECADTFLKVADICGIEEACERNHGNARDVYEIVRRFSTSVVPTHEEQLELTRKLDELRRRLNGLGYRVSP